MREPPDFHHGPEPQRDWSIEAKHRFPDLFGDMPSAPPLESNPFKGIPSGPHPPGFHHFKAGVQCGHRMGMLEGRWSGFVKGLCIGIGLGFAIACLFITCL